MIKQLGDNDVYEAIQLMNKSTQENIYNSYTRNESKWISFLINIIDKQKDNPNYLAIGNYKNNKLNGFLLAHTFIGHYNDDPIMDVKDCIVDSDNSNAYTVIRLFDSMIDHIRKHNGKKWRADSIRTQEDTWKYAKLLQLKYNAELFYAAHGNIGE